MFLRLPVAQLISLRHLTGIVVLVSMFHYALLSAFSVSVLGVVLFFGVLLFIQV